jgi:hypothetical protein
MIFFRFTCPLGHRTGTVDAPDTWQMGKDRKYRDDEPQIFCPHCGASCNVVRVP